MQKLNYKNYLNLGCGTHYNNNWTNLDFIKTGDNVIAHNLLNGIPFDSNSFDVVYHSHVLEHFSKEDGILFLKECFRVLKPSGVIRIAIPDLEQIVRNYIKFLEKGVLAPNDELVKANYEWMLLEMYDQTVRNHSGGLMSKYLKQEEIINEDFMLARIGWEGRNIREYFKQNQNRNPEDRNTNNNWKKYFRPKNYISFVKWKLNSFSDRRMRKTKESAIGKFRLSGEIHQWMYDRYSLMLLLKEIGFEKFIVRDAKGSYIENWDNFKLDTFEGQVRKPDSLFVEAIKPRL